MTDGDYIDLGEHSVMDRIVESVRRTPEANTILYVNYTLIKKKKKYGSM